MPLSIAGTTEDPHIPGEDCYWCENTGTVTISGKWSRSNGAVYAQKIITFAYKVCEPPHYKDSPGLNLRNTPPEKYCSDGHLELVQTTTDCNGNYSITLSSNHVTAICVMPGDWIVNPNFACGGEWAILNPASAWDYSCLWSTDLVLSGTAVSSGLGGPASGIGGITDASVTLSSSGGIAGYVYTTPCDPNRYDYLVVGCQNASGVYAGAWGWENVPDPDHPGRYCQRAIAINGAYTLDITFSTPAWVKVYASKNGRVYPLGGVNLTVGDSCGNSVTVTTGGSGGFYGGCAARLNNIDWTLINSVVVNSGLPTDCDPATWASCGALSSTSEAILIDPMSPDLVTKCVSYRFQGTGFGPLLGVLVQVNCDDAPAIRLQADVYEQILAVSFVGTDNSLKTRVHPSPLAQIGASVDGWLAVTTLESANANDIGMVFLPNGKLYLVYDYSGAKKFRTSEKIGIGAPSDWSAPATPSPNVSRHSASGRGEEQAWRFRALSTASPAYSGSGNIEFSQCRDGRGAEWTAPVTAATGARGVYCGGAFLGNGYGLLWKRDADGVVYWKTSGDATTWASGNGTATALTGTPVSLTRTHAGLLVGLTWDSTSKKCRAARSADRGLTWEQDTSDIVQIPALDTPPVLVSIAHAALAVWTAGDQPLFACSVDGGRSWR